MKVKDDYAVLEKINKMFRRDVKKPINSVEKVKDPNENIDETRMIKKKLVSIEKNLRSEEEALDFEREKIKNPEYSAVLKTLQIMKEDPQESMKKPSILQKFESKQNNSAHVIKEFNNDLAFVTKLKKIDREGTTVENVRNLHFDYKLEKLVKQANFKQNECFENNAKKFHFLTSTQAYESSKVLKFQRGPDYLDSTASLFFKMPHHQRAQTSYRIKSLNMMSGKKTSDHVKLLLKMTDRQMNSCKSEGLQHKFRLDTPNSFFESINNNDYSILFSKEVSNEL
jgi:hypothetical protein